MGGYCGTVSIKFTLANVVTKSLARVCTTEALCNSDTTLKSCKAAGGECKQECCATDLCNSAQSASGTSAPKPVSATTAAKGSAGSSAFSVLLTVACCFATFFF